jgi:haloalkane dehalogenase
MKDYRSFFVRLFSAATLVALVAGQCGAGANAATTNGVSGAGSGMRGKRYCELLIATRDHLKVQAAVYSTAGLNDCPDNLWSSIEADTLKKQLGAIAVVKNGPRYWMIDASSYSVPGEVKTFDGLQAREDAMLELPLSSLVGGINQSPYVVRTVDRTTVWTFLAGKPAYELVDPDGKVYVMQSYAQIVDPKLTMSELATLGSRLKLPSGWKYRVVTPKSNILVRAIDGKAYVVQDDLKNTYQRYE